MESVECDLTRNDALNIYFTTVARKVPVCYYRRLKYFGSPFFCILSEGKPSETVCIGNFTSCIPTCNFHFKRISWLHILHPLTTILTFNTIHISQVVNPYDTDSFDLAINSKYNCCRKFKLASQHDAIINHLLDPLSRFDWMHISFCKCRIVSILQLPRYREKASESTIPKARWIYRRSIWSKGL